MLLQRIKHCWGRKADRWPKTTVVRNTWAALTAQSNLGEIKRKVFISTAHKMTDKKCSWGKFWRSELGSVASHCYALLNTWAWEDGCHSPGDLPFSPECWKSTAGRSGCPSSSLHRHRASSPHMAGTGSSCGNKAGSRSWGGQSRSRGCWAKRSSLVLSQHRSCRHNRICFHMLTSKFCLGMANTNIILCYQWDPWRETMWSQWI